MAEQIIYSTLDNLAERYIPEGMHELLHVNSREYWTDLMLELIGNGAVKKKLTVLVMCAINWEALITRKISPNN